MSKGNAHKQTAFKFKTWGGKRRGAGRKPKGWRSSERHIAREQFYRLTPAHVTLRLVAGYENLRGPAAFFAICAATKTMLRHVGFRIVHLSLEVDHLHLIVEADDHVALERGMQSFEISAAKRLNRTFGRRGTVFADRYHARLLTSPTQARNCIAYVLNNWRRHDQDEVNVDVRFWDIDYFSSAISFDGWKELVDQPFRYDVPADRRLRVQPPQSWLLRVGWRKAGTISMYDVPGPRR